MLLKNKAPSSKPHVATTKSPKPSPKRFKKNVLNESNILKHGNVSTIKSVIGVTKTQRKIDKDYTDIKKANKGDIVECIDIKKENVGNEPPSVANEMIFEVEKPKWDIINLSTVDNLSEPGIYYKQEPLIKTFSDKLCTSNTVISVSETDSTSIKLDLSVKKSSKKRKLENERANAIKRSKVDQAKHSTNNSNKSNAIHTTTNDKTETKKKDVNNLGIGIDFNLGSIVWAKAQGFCWWPAIVDDDPDLNMFYWYSETKPDLVTHYHVTFLDDDVSRCWVSPRNIKIFFPDPEMKSMNIKTCKKSHLKMMQKAIDTAEKCLNLEPQVRLSIYSFTVRFNGKSNLWARADIKKPTKAKTVDTFQSLAIETSILEAKSNVLVSDSQQSRVSVSSKKSEPVKRSKESKKSTKRS